MCSQDIIKSEKESKVNRRKYFPVIYLKKYLYQEHINTLTNNSLTKKKKERNLKTGEESGKRFLQRRHTVAHKHMKGHSILKSKKCNSKPQWYHYHTTSSMAVIKRQIGTSVICFVLFCSVLHLPCFILASWITPISLIKIFFASITLCPLLLTQIEFIQCDYPTSHYSSFF